MFLGQEDLGCIRYCNFSGNVILVKEDKTTKGRNGAAADDDDDVYEVILIP